MPTLQREAAWAEERHLGDLQQSVPQNGHVHLRSIVFFFATGPQLASILGDRKGTTTKLCDKGFAEHSDELSGAICLKILVLLSTDR